MSDDSIINKIKKATPLRSKIKVLNEMGFIELISKLGYRENKMWTPDEDEILQILMDFADEHTNRIMKEIDKHNKKFE